MTLSTAGNIGISAAVIIVVLSIAAPISGQTLAPAVKGQQLTAEAAVGAGYDDDVLAGSGTPIGDPRIQASGGYGLTDLGLRYSAENRRVSVGASASSAFRFYRLDEPFTARNVGGAAGVSVALTTRLRANAGITGQNSSQYIFWVFPGLTESPLGQTSLPSLDYSLTSTAGTSYDANTSLTYGLTRRSSLAAEYGYGEARFGEDAFRLKRNRWAGRYTYGFTRYASLRLGYGVEDAEYNRGQRFQRRVIDAGIDYARPLSFSRRTTFKFGAGTATLDDGESTFSTVTGHANLNHVLSRRWTLNAAYNRGVGFIDGFVDPFVADSAAISTFGGFGRRVQVGLTAAYSNGDVGLSGSRSQSYETYTATSRMQVTLARNTAAFGEYVYYHYRFDPSVVLPLNSPRALNRRGVRGGVSYTVAFF